MAVDSDVTAPPETIAGCSYNMRRIFQGSWTDEREKKDDPYWTYKKSSL
jgi:hypothetical protein